MLGAIQSGAKLRKAVTVDRSIVQGAGHVLSSSDDQHAPDQPSSSDSALAINGAKPGSSEEDARRAGGVEGERASTKSNQNRQSVDWYGGLAADRYPSPTLAEPSQPSLPEVAEESDDIDVQAARGDVQETSQSIIPADTAAPAMGIHQDAEGADDPDAYFDMASCTFFGCRYYLQHYPDIFNVAATKVRSLYSYQGQRPQDASFEANSLIIAHPAKDSSSEWLYGIVPATGSRGWLPRNYVEELGKPVSEST